MTQAEFNLCASAIRELKIKAQYQQANLSKCQARFPSAFCEAILEVLNRFEERLSGEPFTVEVQSRQSSTATMEPRRVTNIN